MRVDHKPLDWSGVRTRRDQLLAATDGPRTWERITDEQRAEIEAYRAALFDITQDFAVPADVVWPAKPTWF